MPKKEKMQKIKYMSSKDRDEYLRNFPPVGQPMGGDQLGLDAIGPGSDATRLYSNDSIGGY